MQQHSSFFCFVFQICFNKNDVFITNKKIQLKLKFVIFLFHLSSIILLQNKKKAKTKRKYTNRQLNLFLLALKYIQYKNDLFLLIWS